MRLIAGLGNPGKEYEGSRHNLGFLVVDRVVARLGLSNWKSEHDALTAKGNSGFGPFLLVKPQTYMNLSGVSVGAIMRYYRVPVEDFVAITDDLDLALGKLRARELGSDGGHKGLRSLIQHLGGQDFKRIRIGIGRPPANQTVIQHVLGGSPEDEAALSDAVDRATDMSLRFLESGEFENCSSS